MTVGRAHDVVPYSVFLERRDQRQRIIAESEQNPSDPDPEVAAVLEVPATVAPPPSAAPVRQGS